MSESNTREVRFSSVSESHKKQSYYDKSWAVVIGIDSYEGSPLLNARNDARAVAQLLKHAYKFEEVHTLFDGAATKSAIEGWLEDNLRNQVEDNDRVVFFFAGHGKDYKNQAGNTVGYLIPYGAKFDKHADLIDMEDLQRACGHIPAKHILIILDCCFSGVAAITGRSKPTEVGKLTDTYLESITSRGAWQILTAGASDEPVADSGSRPGHSAFTSALLDALKGEADHNDDKLITATELAAYLSPRVTRETTHRGGRGQTPFFNYVIGSEQGDFVFLVPDLESIQAADLPLETGDTLKPKKPTKRWLHHAATTPTRKRWLVASLFALLAVALGVLGFRRVAETGLDLEVATSELGFTLSGEGQAKELLSNLELTTFEASDFQSISHAYRDELGNMQSLTIENSVGLTPSETANGELTGSMTLSQITLPAGCDVFAWPSGDNVYHLELLGCEATAEVVVDGPVNVTTSATQTINFRAPTVLVLKSLQNTLRLDFRPKNLTADETSSVFQVVKISGLVLSRTEDGKPTSAITTGTLNLADRSFSKELVLGASDRLRFENLDGELRLLQLRDNTVQTRVVGTASAIWKDSRNVTPSLLERWYTSQPVLLIGSIIVSIFGLLTALRGWEGRR